MAGETTLTQIGNLTADPELKFTNSGIALVSFTVASTPRMFDKKTNEWKEGESLFLRCTAWREMAEHIAASLTKGTRVIVQGNLGQRTYEHEGQRRTSYELDVQEIGPSLRYATAQVTRSQKGQGGSTGGFGGGNSSSPGNSVQGGAGEWASPGAEYDGPAPF